MEQYDVIVVGGGSAGAALAGRLSDTAGRSVLLLEAGPDYARIEDFPLEIRRANVSSALAPGSPFGWPIVTQWTAGARMPLPRGRIIGGGSSVNGAYYVRGLAADFDRWAESGNPQWSFDKVLPFFREGESDREFGADEAAHGSTGPLPITRAMPGQMSPISEHFFQACLDLGVEEDRDKNGLHTGDGVGALPANIQDGVRFNSAMAHLTPRRGRPNLTVRGHALVERVLIEGRRAVGVRAVVGGKRQVIRGEEIILSAGAAKSPHLLMLSGIGPADELLAHGITVVQDLPGVGRDFMDHAEVLVGYKAADVPLPVPNDTALIEAVAHRTAEGSDFGSDLEIMPMTLPLMDATMGRAAGISQAKAMASMASHPIGAFKAVRRADLSSMVRMTSSMGANAFIVSVLNPLSRGRMTLTSANPSVFPRSEHRSFSDPEDRRRMREAIRFTVELMRTSAFAPMVRQISPQLVDVIGSDRDLDRWMLLNPAPSGHLMGTCKMGPSSDPGTVVDERCRVHGIDNLRVVDLSIAPDLLRRGPNATAMMMGARAADLIDAETA
ncbi:GMC family oxidoreductase [Leucobacter tenebrionis]|uniref:GMC family oxidoreductase n=1 Tax=Leucobacter tenebrionis TaxID=2873270 RepID=UPI001CA658C7|nr:GMC family oxidoreductase N-terminal domain-containing protein [Leucobacter tenebrionis]QZY51505.1 GMC family oxidoreductase N-terminal domain-containing protein [Leucobacter tenebrionis]